MLRVNYGRPEPIPPAQPFPLRVQIEEAPDPSGSRGLALMVVAYLVAMFAGILLLGHLTAPTLPTTQTATLNK